MKLIMSLLTITFQFKFTVCLPFSQFSPIYCNYIFEVSYMWRLVQYFILESTEFEYITVYITSIDTPSTRNPTFILLFTTIDLHLQLLNILTVVWHWSARKLFQSGGQADNSQWFQFNSLPPLNFYYYILYKIVLPLGSIIFS